MTIGQNNERFGAPLTTEGMADGVIYEQMIMQSICQDAYLQNVYSSIDILPLRRFLLFPWCKEMLKREVVKL